MTPYQPKLRLLWKETDAMLPTMYVRPVAYHRHDVHRLLLRDEWNAWYLWMGDDSRLIEIEPELAHWIYERPEIFPTWGPAMWFDVSALPVASGPQRRSSGN
jgi:hypothetical protein